MTTVDLAGFVPAAYDEVLAVTAMADFNGQPGGGAVATCLSDVDETPAGFSNFAAIGSPDANHTIAAPAVCILSTWKSRLQDHSGTSMASPHVAVQPRCASAQASARNSRVTSTIDKLRLVSRFEGTAYGFDGYFHSPVADRYDGYRFGRAVTASETLSTLTRMSSTASCIE